MEKSQGLRTYCQKQGVRGQVGSFPRCELKFAMDCVEFSLILSAVKQPTSLYTFTPVYSRSSFICLI